MYRYSIDVYVLLLLYIVYLYCINYKIYVCIIYDRELVEHLALIRVWFVVTELVESTRAVE